MESISPYLLAVTVAWVGAQGAKYVIASFRSGTLRQFRKLYLSGNMPSAHSASVMALLVMIGARDGLQSGLFALAALFAAIVMYDAMMVRRSSGEQGKALVELMNEQSSAIVKPRVAKGHTPVEVAVGALLGVGIGIVVFLATNS